MLRKILLAVGLLATVLLVVIITRPEDFRITRSAVLPAAPAAVFAQVNDFHRWSQWSPWAALDPKAKISFFGPDSGPDASFAWSGNAEVGEGRMTIVESRPDERVGISLLFTKPFRATNYAEFTFRPERDGTRVTWTMTGQNNFLGKAMSLFVDCDKMIGAQFESGLANLGRAAAAAPR